MRNLHLYVPSKGTYMANQLYYRRTYFSAKEEVVIGGGLNAEAMGFENDDFSDEDKC